MKLTKTTSRIYIFNILTAGLIGFFAGLFWHIFFYLNYINANTYLYLSYIIFPSLLYVIPLAITYYVTRLLLRYFGLNKVNSIALNGLIPCLIGAVGVSIASLYYVGTEHPFAMYTGEKWWQAIILLCIYEAGLVISLYIFQAQTKKTIQKARDIWRLLLVFSIIFAIICPTVQNIIQETKYKQSVKNSINSIQFNVYIPKDSVLGKFKYIDVENTDLLQTVTISYEHNIDLVEYRKHSTENICEYEMQPTTDSRKNYCQKFKIINGHDIYTDSANFDFYLVNGDTVIKIHQDALIYSDYRPTIFNSESEIKQYETDTRLYAVPALEQIVSNLQLINKTEAARQNINYLK